MLEEPSFFTAGETVEWTKALPDYPSGTWTLKYALQAPGRTLIAVTAANEPDLSYSIAILAATSASYAAGSYTWTAYVEAGPARHVVARGSISILASPLAMLGSTHATRMLALIEAALEGRIPNGLESTNIDGQQIDRIPVIRLHELREQYRNEVLMEQKAAIAAAGGKVRNTIGIRFVKP